MGIKIKALVGLFMLLLPVTGLAVAGDVVPLMEAVKKGDQVAVRSFVEQHADVNMAEADGATALMWAADQNRLDLADLLIRAGANVNVVNDDGATPLWLACSRGAGVMVEK